MKFDTKARIKELMPPFLWTFLKRHTVRNMKTRLYYYGSFQSYDEAEYEARCHGNTYTDGYVLERVAPAIEKVRKGEAVFERDGICFYEETLNYPLLSALFYSMQGRDSICVLDYGGSLGSTYFQYRKYMQKIPVSWKIIEQPKFVEYGREHIEEIEFFSSIEEMENGGVFPDIVIFSSVIQYLEHPYNILEKILNRGYRCVIFDRTAFISDKERFVCQYVPPQIYSACYPCFLFLREKFLSIIQRYGYECLYEWQNPGIPILENGNIEETLESGFLFNKVIC